jgi:hypothetical protein
VVGPADKKLENDLHGNGKGGKQTAPPLMLI